MDGDQSLGREHTMEYTDYVIENYTLKPYTILRNITPKKLIFKKSLKDWLKMYVPEPWEKP